ncbi:hypothetical protein BKA64DRAFT_642784 [Cadophora sp. MPI-SDFR-AT-0126]|nr:hypothetical protein BKA64DRAFT_642784 [Leotiomycetes sp. MPI-SDFR-AT-0126]
MKYGHLPGGPPQRQRSSPARMVASHMLSQFRRPGRIRSRLLLLSIALFGCLFIIYGRRHSTELHFTATTLTTYIPTGITDAIATYSETEEQDTRWGDTKSQNGTDANHIVLKKPKFHLLIPAYKPSPSLCRTLLSAAILDYPPPTLIGYGGTPDKERPGMDEAKRTFSFLTGKEARDDDLVMVVSEDTIFQLPATTALTRFFSTLHSTSTNLLTKYGRLPSTDNHNTPKHQRPQRYTSKVLFTASKSCSNAPDSPACLSIPDSPLPHPISTSISNPLNIGGNDSSSTTKPPRFLEVSMHISRASSLIPLYKRATELLESGDIGKSGKEYVFEQLFGEQEYARSLFLEEERAKRPAWRNWLADIFSSTPSEGIVKPKVTSNQEGSEKEEQKEDGESEFGIMLDYSSTVFQDMRNSAQDLQFVIFGDEKEGTKNGAPSRIEGKAKTWKIKRPIRLPPDLSNAPDPFGGIDVLSIKPSQDSRKNIPGQEVTGTDASWADVPLLMNLMVPSSTVPAAFDFRGVEPQDFNEIWNNLWFHNSSRRLLTQHIQILTANPNPEPLVITTPPTSSTSSSLGSGDTDSDTIHYLDIRPGKSSLGAWTDKGEWIPWREICAGFGEEVFGDGFGEGEFDFGGDGEGEGEGDGGGNGGKGGMGAWVEEGEEYVKGLWGMVVGGGGSGSGDELEEGKEDGKGEGQGTVEEHGMGSFEQGVVVGQDEENNGNGKENENEDVAEGKGVDNDGNVIEGKGEGKDEKKHDNQHTAYDDQKENPEIDNNTKDEGNKGDDQKAEVEDNESMKDKDTQGIVDGGSNGQSEGDEGKVEEGAVRFEDEKEDQKEGKE